MMVDCADDVTLEKKIGSGSFGNVYRVSEACVEKRYKRDDCGDRYEVDGIESSWLREIAAFLAMRQHRNVVRGEPCVLRCEDSDSSAVPSLTLTFEERMMSCFVVRMPPAIGDLHKFVTNMTREAGEEDLFRKEETRLLCTCIFHDLASGLAHMHAERFLHRDLKPSNCLVYHDQSSPSKVRAVLADLGSSCYANGDEPLRELYATTTCFAAPEYLLDGTSSRASDVWSLGMVFLFILTLEMAYVDSHLDANQSLVSGRRATLQRYFHMFGAPAAEWPEWRERVLECWGRKEVENVERSIERSAAVRGGEAMEQMRAMCTPMDAFGEQEERNGRAEQATALVQMVQACLKYRPSARYTAERLRWRMEGMGWSAEGNDKKKKSKEGKTWKDEISNRFPLKRSRMVAEMDKELLGGASTFDTGMARTKRSSGKGSSALDPSRMRERVRPVNRRLAVEWLNCVNLGEGLKNRRVFVRRNALRLMDILCCGDRHLCDSLEVEPICMLEPPMLWKVCLFMAVKLTIMSNDIDSEDLFCTREEFKSFLCAERRIVEIAANHNWSLLDPALFEGKREQEEEEKEEEEEETEDGRTESEPGDENRPDNGTVRGEEDPVLGNGRKRRRRTICCLTIF